MKITVKFEYCKPLKTQKENQSGPKSLAFNLAFRGGDFVVVVVLNASSLFNGRNRDKAKCNLEISSGCLSCSFILVIWAINFGLALHPLRNVTLAASHGQHCCISLFQGPDSFLAGL